MSRYHIFQTANMSFRNKTLYLSISCVCVCALINLCCSVCIMYSHTSGCVCCANLLVFVWRPEGWCPQRPALALSQARLQQLSKSLHNTEHCTGMLLSSLSPLFFFKFFFPSLHHSLFDIEFLPLAVSLCLSIDLNNWISCFLPQLTQPMLWAMPAHNCNSNQLYWFWCI